MSLVLSVSVWRRRSITCVAPPGHPHTPVQLSTGQVSSGVLGTDILSTSLNLVVAVMAYGDNQEDSLIMASESSSFVSRPVDRH